MDSFLSQELMIPSTYLPFFADMCDKVRKISAELNL